MTIQAPRKEMADFLAGGGEMSELIRAKDWAQTPLGSIDTWPQSLRTTVSVCLNSRFPILLWWGQDLIQLYNDAYRPMLGATKHPLALGSAGRVIWPEIWHIIGPMLAGVMERGEATWSDDLLLVLERNGYPEECYFTFSYSPIRDESGGVGGVFTAVHETTQRVIGERRLATLRELAAETAQATTEVGVCSLSLNILAHNPLDLPFAILYLLDPTGTVVHLAGATGLPADASAAAPDVLPFTGEADGVWPLWEVLASGEPQVVENLGDRWGGLGGPWPDAPPQQAVVLPLGLPGPGRAIGFLVAGISAGRAFDDDYKGFCDLVGRHIATAITNARAYEEERKRAEALAELDRAKTTFFSNVSHEFRTPLTLMLGPLEDLLGLANGELPPTYRDSLALVHRNALRLQKLVNTLLDFSRIEAGRIQAAYMPTDLAALTSDLVGVFRSAVESAGLRLLVHCPPLTEPVYVDRDMWEKIVLNLVSNAFKFTLEGEIEVTLREGPDHIEMAVRDTGPGISAEQLPRIFERFHRVDRVQARTYEGTGIGLSLVQELVRLHGGSVSVQSEEGQGTTFTVLIPKGKAHLPAEQIRTARSLTSTALSATHYVEEALHWLPPTEANIPGPATASEVASEAKRPLAHPRPRIVWADDNADMREYVGRLLGELYDVEAVPDGETALAAVRRQPPDLVLADVMMPRLDGFGLLGALRAAERTRSIPVILLSARAGEEARVEGLQAGADDYMIKPFSGRELLARVQSHLALAQTRHATAEALREADRRKDEFLATLAHELRNPLAPIRNAVHILALKGSSDPAVQAAHALIDRQLSHMVRIIDDLLDVGRITRGKLDLRVERVELASVIAQAVETTRPLVEGAHHHLSVALPTEPILLEADPVRLAQVFANLLNNAVKYTPPGGQIWLTARCHEDGVIVSVRDTGAGIPPDQLDSIFEMFNQVDRSLERTQGGLGIGLTLVKRLVEMHHGTVEALSEGVGRGSEFLVRLPILSQAVSIEPAAPPAEPGNGPPHRRILIVDDHRDIAMSLAELLAMDGHATKLAHNGLDALEMAAQWRPDIVLLDIGLPKLNGYDVCRRIRKEPWGQAMVVVALTGWGQAEDRRQSQAAGFDHHLVKPVDYRDIQKLFDWPRGDNL
ncbi:MAG: response regulator [Anaerolineae bacterium]|nr:response regulator [Anaerolineae bacterium]